MTADMKRNKGIMITQEDVKTRLFTDDKSMITEY